MLHLITGKGEAPATYHSPFQPTEQKSTDKIIKKLLQETLGISLPSYPKQKGESVITILKNPTQADEVIINLPMIKSELQRQDSFCKTKKEVINEIEKFREHKKEIKKEARIDSLLTLGLPLSERKTRTLLGFVSHTRAQLKDVHDVKYPVSVPLRIGKMGKKGAKEVFLEFYTAPRDSSLYSESKKNVTEVFLIDKENKIGSGAKKDVFYTWFLNRPQRFAYADASYTEVDCKVGQNEVDNLLRFLGRSNIVKVHKLALLKQTGSVRETIIMDYYPQGLYELLKLCIDGDVERGIPKLGHLSDQRKISLAKQVIQALDHLHNPEDGQDPVIHRDIKPENYLLDDKGVAHLTDFGYASPGKVDNNTGSVSNSCGSVCYLPYEYFTCKRKIGIKRDIFAEGSILWMIFANSAPPFFMSLHEEKRQQAVKEMEIFFKQKPPKSQPLRALIWKMWHLKPEKRPTTQEILQVLDEIEKKLSSEDSYLIKDEFEVDITPPKKGRKTKRKKKKSRRVDGKGGGLFRRTILTSIKESVSGMKKNSSKESIKKKSGEESEE